ncbi:MAG: tetratricopeptide repeat protein [Proteobacteria bacterium]|nr:tetratricopeptide repeat protein [Pseudomonadota bacterium]
MDRNGKLRGGGSDREDRHGSPPSSEADRIRHDRDDGEAMPALAANEYAESYESPGETIVAGDDGSRSVADNAGDVGDVEDIEEIEEIEEIDDLELIEEMEEEGPGGQDDAAIPPPLPPEISRPSRPMSAVAPPPLPLGPLRDAAPAGPLGQEIGSGPLATEAPQVPQVLSEPLGPPELDLARPTVVDRAVEELGEAMWGERLRGLSERLDACEDSERIGVLAYELGELYMRRFGDEAQAVTSYNRALQADPSLRPNLWAIRRMFYAREMWPNLTRLIDAEIRCAQNESEEADLWLEKGHLLYYRLGDPVGARDSYENAVVLNAGSPAGLQALMHLERMALVEGNHGELDRIWSLLAETVTEPRRKLGYLLDLIELHIGRGELEHAQDLVAEAIALGVGTDKIAAERQRIAELSNDAEGVIAALEARATHLMKQYGHAGVFAAGDNPAHEPTIAADHAQVLRMRLVALRRQQARIITAQFPPDADLDGEAAQQALGRAWQYLQKAHDVVVTEPLLLSELAELAETLERHDDLAELYQSWEAAESDSTRKLSLSIRRADALVRGGKRAEANTLLDSLAEAAPGYLPLAALRERDALVNQDWAELAKAWDELASGVRSGRVFDGDGTSQPGDRASKSAAAERRAWEAVSWTAAGDLYANRLDRPVLACERYQNAVRAVPGYPPAVAALAALYERTGQMDEAAGLLEMCLDPAAQDSQVSRIGPGQTRAMLERLAWAYQQSGNLERVLSVQKRLLALDPDGPDSIRLYWRMEETLAALGRPAERAEVLVECANRLDAPESRAALLYDAARLYEHEADNPDAAADLYRQVLAMWPGDRYARAALIGLLKRAQRWSELAEERRKEAAQLSAGPALARAMREAAGVLVDHLGRRDEAIELCRDLLDRMPGDPGALHDLAQLLADRPGSPDALLWVFEQELVAEIPTQAQVTAALRLAVAHEKAGRIDEALEAYRRAAQLDPHDLWSVVSIAELAADAGDDFAHIEAFEQLAERVSDGRLASEIFEEVGWLWILASADLARARTAFDRAIKAGPERPGPRLGAVLLEARRGDAVRLGDALAELSDTVKSPQLAAAILLRAAVVAETNEDTELLHDRLHRALQRTENDSTLIVAAEYATALRPEEAQSTTQEQLLARADLFGMRASIAGNPAARADWELDRAEALEAAGRLREAALIVASVLGNNLDDIRALQLLRRICRRGGDRASLARASLALARILTESQGKLELLREAAAILDRELGDGASAVPVYRRILVEMPGADEFDRVAEICRNSDDVRTLFEVLSDRLNWLDVACRADRADRSVSRLFGPAGNGAADSIDPGNKVPLLYERARLRQAIGDSRGVIRDLGQLLDIDGNHPDGLLMQARALLAEGDAQRAAKLFERYLAVETDADKRAAAELAFSETLAEDMDDVAGAIEQLEHVVARSPSDLDLRERLVSLLLRASRWQEVVTQIREIEELRVTPIEQARDELRVAAIYRDRLGDIESARSALSQARALDSLNIDAVRELAESTGDDAEARGQILASAARDLRRAIAQRPGEAGLYQRLAVLHGWQSDPDAEYYALCATQALGSLSAEKNTFVADRAARLRDAPAPSSTLSETDWSAHLSAVTRRGADAIWLTLAEAVAKMNELDPVKLGFGRADKISSRNLARRFARLAAIADAFGVEADFYISDAKPGFAEVLSVARPVLFLGADVARAETAEQRFSAGRALAHARLGTGNLAELRAQEVGEYFAAAAKLAGLSPIPPELAGIIAAEPEAVEQRLHGLQKYLGRRERKALGGLADQFADIGDGSTWRRAALQTVTRAGLLCAGEVGPAFETLRIGQGGRAIFDDPEALSFLSWMISEDHLNVRKTLGITPRG